jgi:hypothetical protein
LVGEERQAYVKVAASSSMATKRRRQPIFREKTKTSELMDGF